MITRIVNQIALGSIWKNCIREDLGWPTKFKKRRRAERGSRARVSTAEPHLGFFLFSVSRITDLLSSRVSLEITGGVYLAIYYPGSRSSFEFCGCFTISLGMEQDELRPTTGGKTLSNAGSRCVLLVEHASSPLGLRRAFCCPSCTWVSSRLISSKSRRIQPSHMPEEIAMGFSTTFFSFDRSDGDGMT